MYEAVTRGHKPVQVNTTVDENGNALSNHYEVCTRWQHHFLNMPSNYQEEQNYNLSNIFKTPFDGATFNYPLLSECVSITYSRYPNSWMNKRLNGSLTNNTTTTSPHLILYISLKLYQEFIIKEGSYYELLVIP